MNDRFGQYLYQKESYKRENSARVPAKFLTIGFASRRRMWETWSRKNLMKAHLGCRSVWSVLWAVKNAFA